MTQTGVRCMIMRGGTSKGAYFVADELPDDPAERDELLLGIMGTPDPRQIDGIGGAHPLTSKVAVVGPAAGNRADVEYLFLQIGVGDRIVTDRITCGNLLSGVAPFAVERGLIEANGDTASVSIHMVNGDSYARSTFAVSHGMPVYEGDAAISGVPGTASPIRLDFEDIAGGVTGAMLPTGSPLDLVAGVECTLIDNGMPVVVMRAADLGITGYEGCAELEANVRLRNRLEEIRLEAGPLMNLGDVSQSTYPKMTMVAPGKDGGSMCTRTFIPHACHSAIGVLGAVSVSTAAILPGTPAASVISRLEGDSIVLEHPSGLFETVIERAQSESGLPRVLRAGVVRTARKLMDGTVFPRFYD
jgi:4-oxalomesaconate tautomerase